MYRYYILVSNTYYPASNCRNNMFIYLHVLLEAAVYAEFTYEVFGFCREMDTTLTSLSVPYVLLAVKTFFFYLCIKRDPGQYSSSVFKNICLFSVQSYFGVLGVITCHPRTLVMFILSRGGKTIFWVSRDRRHSITLCTVKQADVSTTWECQM